MGHTVLTGDRSGKGIDAFSAGYLMNPPPFPDGPGSLEARTHADLDATIWSYSDDLVAIDADGNLHPKKVKPHKTEKRLVFLDYLPKAGAPIAKAIERGEGDFRTLLNKHCPAPGDPAAAVRMGEIRARFFAPDADRLTLLADADPETLAAVIGAPAVYQNRATAEEKRAMETAYLRQKAAAEFSLWEARRAAREHVALALRVADSWIREPGDRNQQLDDIASGKVTA